MRGNSENSRGMPAEYKDVGKYREINKTCRECNQEFVINVPEAWFNGENEIDQGRLPGGVTIENARKLINKEVCATCQNKE